MKAQSERANVSLAGTELQLQSWKQFGHAYAEQPESWIVLRNTSANHQAKKASMGLRPIEAKTHQHGLAYMSNIAARAATGGLSSPGLAAPPEAARSG